MRLKRKLDISLINPNSEILEPVNNISTSHIGIKLGKRMTRNYLRDMIQKMH